jgi:hypothetical protein
MPSVTSSSSIAWAVDYFVARLGGRPIPIYGKRLFMKLPQVFLLVDDAAMIFLITFMGIQFHQSDPSIFTRLPFTFLPFLAAWIFFAAILQMYNLANASSWQQLWRILAAASLAAHTGAAIRALWLNTPLVPIFVFVMGAALAVGLLISRSIFILAIGTRWSNPKQ